MKTFEEERDEVRAAIEAAQREQEKANAIARREAERAAASRATADQAAAKAFELQAAEQRRRDEEFVAGYDKLEAAIRKAIADQHAAVFAAVADDDLNAAWIAYRGWRRERSRLWLAHRDRQAAKARLGHYGPSGPTEAPVFTQTPAFSDLLREATERVAGNDLAELDAATAG